jgi:hypothetical protein
MKSFYLIKFTFTGPGIPDEAGLLKAVIQKYGPTKNFGYASGTTSNRRSIRRNII